MRGLHNNASADAITNALFPRLSSSLSLAMTATRIQPAAAEMSSNDASLLSMDPQAPVGQSPSRGLYVRGELLREPESTDLVATATRPTAGTLTPLNVARCCELLTASSTRTLLEVEGWG